jgi:hypothetical protein
MSLLPFPLIGFTGLLYASAAAAVAGIVFALLLSASLRPNGAKTEAAGKALYCVIMETLGAGLMTVSGLPACLSVLSGIALPRNSYIGMLLLFAIGGWMFLWYENIAETIDPVSKAIPMLIFRYTFKLVGALSILFSLVTLVMVFLFSYGSLPATWWVDPLVLLAYGIFVSWCTRFSVRPTVFRSSPVVVLHATPAKAGVKRKK